MQMERKKLLNRLTSLPVWAIVLLTVVCAAALVYTFVRGYESHPTAYITYVLSFYTLCVIVLRCIRLLPQKYTDTKQRIYDDPVGGRFMTDMKFRTHVTLYGSLVVNLIYIAINFVSGIFYHSAWFYVFAFYYTILAAMRFLLVRFVNRIGIGNDRRGELLRSRLCGVILLTINLALSGAVLMILYQNRGFEYSGILIYVMAAYTFYITAMAIKNLIKYRKLGSPVMSMAKIISMAAALVSMLSLETAMFSQFGQDMPPEYQRIFIVLTGAGVSAAIVTMSVYSIAKNTKELRKEDRYGK